jgi:hypothetical protein
MFPILGSDHDEILSSFQFDAEVCSLSQAGFAKNSNRSANAFFVQGPTCATSTGFTGAYSTTPGSRAQSI